MGISWNDLLQFKMTWEDFSKLVPFHVAQESLPDLDAAAGPPSDQPIPRRLLACLRDQMDVLAHEHFKANAKSETRAEVTAEANTFAQTILDEAKRIQEKKRPAETTPSVHKIATSQIDVDAQDAEITPGQHTQSQVVA